MLIAGSSKDKVGFTLRLHLAKSRDNIEFCPELK